MSQGFFGAARIKNTLNQHRKVLEAIKNHKSDEAEKAIYEHLIAARRDVGKYEHLEQKTKSSSRKPVTAANTRR
jgi:DNA-binding FadR family transcriptional regulator